MAVKKRLIDVNAFREFWNKNYRHQYANDTFLFALVNFPTVDAVEVVHGRWKKVYTCHGEQAWGYECDQCKADNPQSKLLLPQLRCKDGRIKRKPPQFRGGNPPQATQQPVSQVRH